MLGQQLTQKLTRAGELLTQKAEGGTPLLEQQLTQLLAHAGELLIQKAEEGVRVCMMVWDDKTSVHVGSTQAGGMMMTHDEETRQFFKGTKVRSMSDEAPWRAACSYPIKPCCLSDPDGSGNLEAKDAGRQYLQSAHMLRTPS